MKQNHGHQACSLHEPPLDVLRCSLSRPDQQADLYHGYTGIFATTFTHTGRCSTIYVQEGKSGLGWHQYWINSVFWLLHSSCTELPHRCCTEGNETRPPTSKTVHSFLSNTWKQSMHAVGYIQHTEPLRGQQG